jgi:hypothetical protein
MSLVGYATTSSHIYRPSTRPCHPPHPLAAARGLAQSTTLPNSSRGKARIASITGVKAAKAPETAETTTPNASNNNSSRYRKPTPSPHPHIFPKNRNTATAGRPPWPANCRNGQREPPPFHQQDPTPALSDEFKRPPVVFTARFTGTIQPTTATFAERCLTTPGSTPTRAFRLRNPETAAIQQAMTTCRPCVLTSTRSVRGVHTTLLSHRPAGPQCHQTTLLHHHRGRPIITSSPFTSVTLPSLSSPTRRIGTILRLSFKDFGHPCLPTALRPHVGLIVY